MTFSIEEANALLASLEPLLKSLRDAHSVMETLHDDVMASIPTNGGGAVHREFAEASREVARAAKAIAEMGVLVRDPSSGLVDFPSVRDGEEVFLCWRLGEESVGWWHPTDTGFAGRLPL